MAFFSPAQRVAAVYAASFVTFGIHVPFVPLLLAGRGLSETEIAAIVAMPMAVRVFASPLLGWVSDRVADRRTVLGAYAVGAALLFLLFGPVRGFLASAAVMALTAILWNGVVPGIDAIALTVARRSGVDYGRMRLWGSLSFVATTALGGVAVGRWGAEATFWLLAAGLALQAASIAFLPAPEETRAAERSAGEPAVRLADLFTDARLVGTLAGAATIQASHAMAYGFSSLYWSSRGIPDWLVGVFWGIGVTVEVVLFAVAGRFAGRLGPVGFLVVGGAGAVLRWGLFPFVSSVWLWGFVQALHALSFAAVHLGTMLHVARHVPERLGGSVQGLVVTVSGLTMAAATFASGPLYARFGVWGFPVMSVLALAGIAIVLASRPQPQRAGSGG